MRISDWSSDVCSSDLLFDKLRDTEPGASGRRTVLLTQLKHALGKHALEEENAIYPALRLAGMDAEADALNDEDRQSVVEGSVSVRVDSGGRRIIKTQTYVKTKNKNTL